MNIVNRTYIGILIELAKVDGHFKNYEYDLIYEFSANLGISEDPLKILDESFLIHESLGALSKQKKYELLKDLVKLIKADNTIHEKEIKYSELIAFRLGFRKTIIKCLLEDYDPNTRTFNNLDEIFKTYDPYYM